MWCHFHLSFCLDLIFIRLFLKAEKSIPSLILFILHDPTPKSHLLEGPLPGQWSKSFTPLYHFFFSEKCSSSTVPESFSLGKVPMRPSHLPSEFSLYVLRLGCWHGTALAYAVSALGEWHGSESNVMEAQLPAYEHCCDLLAEKNEVQQTAFDFSCPRREKAICPSTRRIVWIVLAGEGVWGDRSRKLTWGLAVDLLNVSLSFPAQGLILKDALIGCISINSCIFWQILSQVKVISLFYGHLSIF